MYISLLINYFSNIFLRILLWFFIAFFIRTQIYFRLSQKQPHQFGRRKIILPTQTGYRFPKKPEWVRREIIRMKAMMPDQGCYKLADTFNRRFKSSRQMTVGKTFVWHVIKDHQYEIAVLRCHIRKRKPRSVPHNLVWGMDLTGKTDSTGKTHQILGILEHASRACLCLSTIKNKASITLLRCLLDAIATYGKPRMVRTDNEAVFTSRLFRLGLWLLGIKHQRIDKGCPWMNGRVERIFGTLKDKLNQWDVDSFVQLNGALHQFRFWYHNVRPHQNLSGRTPAEVWQGKDIYTTRIKKEYGFEGWDGLLTGYYLRI